MKNTISELKNTVDGIKSRQVKQRIELVSWRTRYTKTPRKIKKRKKD